MASETGGNAPSSDGHSDGARSTGVSVAISNEMVRLYKALFGRGPTKAWTEWAGPDVVAVLLEETLAPAERGLARLGDHQRLREVRAFFQCGGSTRRWGASRWRCSYCTRRAMTDHPALRGDARRPILHRNRATKSAPPASPVTTA